MSDVVTLSVTGWDHPCTAAEQERAIVALEAGNVLLMPQLHFPLQSGEGRFLSAEAGGGAKNVSLDPARDTLRGSKMGEVDREALRSMIARFATLSAGLVRNLLPRYAEHLQQGRTSYRPIEISGRTTSWRADDTRLHVDSFPSQPLQGRRILRVFSNLDPQGHARSWRLGEPFEDVARRYALSAPNPLPGASTALHVLGITKSRRSAYDHFMLQLHDRMKADLAYQSEARQIRYDFSPGNTWIVFTDQVSHAAMSGRYALEQTFYLPVHAMQEPLRSPLRVLERLLGRPLV
jgi:hypothetical protein